MIMPQPGDKLYEVHNGTLHELTVLGHKVMPGTGQTVCEVRCGRGKPFCVTVDCDTTPLAAWQRYVAMCRCVVQEQVVAVAVVLAKRRTARAELQAARQQLRLLVKGSKPKAAPSRPATVTAETPVANLGFRSRVTWRLRRLGIRTVGELCQRSARQLRRDARVDGSRSSNFGAVSLQEVRDVLGLYKLVLKEPETP